jgi:hypothetical protein
MRTLLFLSVIFLCQQTLANAAVVASLSGAFDTRKPVHLLAVGYSHGMGLQFVEAAVAQGRRYLELHPDHEVILIRNNETGTALDASQLEAFGLKVISQDASPESSQYVVKVANQFQAIASLEFFSHSSIHAGAGLEGDSVRFNINAPAVMSLRGRFLPQGFIFFHGCNAGFFQAPEMSKLLGIPVFGALTSTDIRRLQTTGEWVIDDPRVSPAELWANVNNVSYLQPVSCAQGGCLRLAPDNGPYQGVWGNYQGGGLPFYKAFCNNGMSELECGKVMATALLGWPSVRPISLKSSEGDFVAVATDFLCPADPRHHADCVQAMENALKPGASEVYSSFQGNTIACDFKSCNVTWQCQYDPQGNPIHGSCSVNAPANHAPVTAVQELKRYVAGFRALRQ